MQILLLFIDVDPVNFEKEIRDEKQKAAMDQKIDAIRRMKVSTTTREQKSYWSKISVKNKAKG